MGLSRPAICKHNVCIMGLLCFDASLPGLTSGGVGGGQPRARSPAADPEIAPARGGSFLLLRMGRHVCPFCCGRGGTPRQVTHSPAAAPEITLAGGGAVFLMRVRGRVFFAGAAGAPRARSLTHRGRLRKNTDRKRCTHDKKQARVPGPKAVHPKC